MRQKAVSSAPQNEAPIQMLETQRGDADRRRRAPDVLEQCRRCRGRACWAGSVQVGDHRHLDVGRAHDAAEDEQDQQRQRQQREQQVVGDHSRQAGQAVAVALRPERPQGCDDPRRLLGCAPLVPRAARCARVRHFARISPGCPGAHVPAAAGQGVHGRGDGLRPVRLPAPHGPPARGVGAVRHLQRRLLLGGPPRPPGAHAPDARA